MKLSSESCFFREIWWVILCRTLICFQTKIPLRLFIRIRGSTKTHPTILGMTIPYLDDRSPSRSRSTCKKLVFFSYSSIRFIGMKYASLHVDMPSASVREKISIFHKSSFFYSMIQWVYYTSLADFLLYGAGLK
jgi:hypothetical protein